MIFLNMTVKFQPHPFPLVVIRREECSWPASFPFQMCRKVEKSIIHSLSLLSTISCFTCGVSHIPYYSTDVWHRFQIMFLSERCQKTSLHYNDLKSFIIALCCAEMYNFYEAAFSNLCKLFTLSNLQTESLGKKFALFGRGSTHTPLTLNILSWLKG
jgi:hypothetical protein